VKKWRVELKVMNGRLLSERALKIPVDDDCGVDRINAMIVDINAEYATMGVSTHAGHDTGIAGTERDDDSEEEEHDSDHEPQSSKRSSKRYVCQYWDIYIYS
jgi:hypothetical protein